jgi:hypothetical protein
LFWFATMCGLIKLRLQPAAWQRAIFAIAAIGSLGLIILSQSGHAAVTLLAVVAFAAVWVKGSKATPGTYALVLAVCGVVLPVIVYLGAMALADRMGGAKMGNSSWEDRSNSIVIGFQMFTRGDWVTWLFGLGPGQTTPVMQRVAKLEAIWSVLLTYIYETGLFGLLAMSMIGMQVFRAWRAMRFSTVFAATVFVWFVGATVTTSYEQLLPIWMALGFLIVWPQVCELAPMPSVYQAAREQRFAAASARQAREIGWESRPHAAAISDRQIDHPSCPQRWSDAARWRA